MTTPARPTPGTTIRHPVSKIGRIHRLRWSAGAVAAFTAIAPVATSHADVVAYLVNVTVRPGYGFQNAESALRYGHQICTDIAAAQMYTSIVDRVGADFPSPDRYHAEYLVNQAVNELCPGLIWNLRQTATDRGADR